MLLEVEPQRVSLELSTSQLQHVERSIVVAQGQHRELTVELVKDRAEQVHLQGEVVELTRLLKDMAKSLMERSAEEVNMTRVIDMTQIRAEELHTKLEELETECSTAEKRLANLAEQKA